ncbi:hypothetical protein, partial [Vibrio cholerae]|uniref:hypothetical protein n=1 Tax=Vibrio cholerae TaxID=666 RepID=UPI001F236E7F
TKKKNNGIKKESQLSLSILINIKTDKNIITMNISIHGFIITRRNIVLAKAPRKNEYKHLNIAR